MVDGLYAVEAVARALGGADIAHGFAPGHAFAHLVHQGFGVLQAYQAAELVGVDPVALGGWVGLGEQAVQFALNVVEPIQELLHGGSNQVW